MNHAFRIVIIAFAVAMICSGAFMLTGCGDTQNFDSNNDNAIVGSWHCIKIGYMGTELEANGEQQSDYTINIQPGSFELNVFGEYVSGTWERTSEDESLGSGGKLADGRDVQMYNLSPGNPLKAVYYVQDDMLIVFLSDSVDADNYIMFKRD